MGTLIVRCYPTDLLLKAADHTYVECSTGARGWKCWGGKAGGMLLRSAPGSTNRANAVAGHNERAGITCYLVNGVCHQAANRILEQSHITVDGARGYSLSVSIFGVLGRRRGFLGACNAPFIAHPNVSGDLEECIGDMAPAPAATRGHLDFQDSEYMAGINRLYTQAGLEQRPGEEDLLEHQMAHFKRLVKHKFRLPNERIRPDSYGSLMAAREGFERQRIRAEANFAATGDGLVFVGRFDELTLEFQDDVAGILDERSYQTLFNLSKDDRIVLSDSSIVEQVYGGRPDPSGAVS
jgi:hypothetical protein